MSWLVAREITRSYGNVRALEAFSLEVEEGEIFALVGPDGAGKTTLIRILCHLIDADKGEASIGGLKVAGQFDQIKPLLGYMPQTFSLYPDLSVEENLVFYGGLHGVTGQAYRNKRDSLYVFSGLGPFSKRRAQALSGGMKQKLALSCALIHDPKILILDEPTTGVDPLSRRQFWEILLRLKQQGVTILVSTPYMDEVARADRACFILGGRKLSEGTPTELAAQFQGSIYYLDEIPTSDQLRRLGTITGLAARRFGTGMHLYLAPGDRVDNYAAPLREAGIAVERLRPMTAELEDRFIQLMEVRA